MKYNYLKSLFYVLNIISFLFLLTASSCNKDTSSNQLASADSLPGKPDTNVALPPATNPTISNVLMNKFIGANGFHEDNINLMQAVGTLRAYCNWDWFQGDSPNNEFIFQNSRGGWYFDDAFQKIKAAGVDPVICLQHTLKDIRSGNKDDTHDEDKPLDANGLKTTDANSYKAFANAMYQLAARYGRTKVADNLLKVPADQKKSGLDLIKYLEVWNEPDKDWKGPDGHFSAEEYAALLSASYDKIKEADPTMKVVMSGLATLSTDFLQKMKVWFDANRKDKKFPADVINMHLYAFNNNINWKNPVQVPAETPEDGKFKEKASSLVQYCKTNIPGTEVWISEFGWDTNPESVLSPKKITGLSMNEVQARWLVRGYLAFAAGGIDKAQMFCLFDPSQNYIATWFGTSGLCDRTLNFAKKTSWYYVYQMKNILSNMVYIGEQSSGNAGVLIYKFKDAASNKGAYVVWSNSSSNTTINNYSLSISKNAAKAEMNELTDGASSGKVSTLSIANNIVSVNATEKPAFIIVDNIQ